MGWNGIGWFLAACLGAVGAAVPFLWPSAREFGYALLIVGSVCFLVSIFGVLRLFIKKYDLGTRKMALLFGVVATWIALTFTLGIAAWSIWKNPTEPFAIGRSAIAGNTSAEEPINWLQGFTSMEGGLHGNNVFSLRFQGANVSKEAVHLKSADITSLIDGTRLNLEIIGNRADGTSKIVPIDQVQLIPPGAPIELVAKFGPADPANPFFVKGLDPKLFLEKWRQFVFEAADEKKKYRFEVNENAFMPFFKGQVGPRVALKPGYED